MNRTQAELVEFKVRQTVGSLTIEGVQVPKDAEERMLQIAKGRLSAKAVRQNLLAKYRTYCRSL